MANSHGPSPSSSSSSSHAQRIEEKKAAVPIQLSIPAGKIVILHYPFVPEMVDLQDLTEEADGRLLTPAAFKAEAQKLSIKYRNKPGRYPSQYKYDFLLLEPEKSSVAAPVTPLPLKSYMIYREIGRGSNATVFLGYDGILDTWCAIKQGAVSLQEVGCLRLFHLMLPVKPLVKQDDKKGVERTVLIPYERGEVLSNVYRWLSPIEAWQVTVQILALINNLHQQDMLYVDLSPKNFIWDRSRQKLKIIDFGEVLQKNAGTESVAGLPGGTPLTMAPEIIKAYVTHKDKPMNYTAAVDLYGLGVIIALVLKCGQVVPFKSHECRESDPAKIKLFILIPSQKNEVVLSDLKELKLSNQIIPEKYQPAVLTFLQKMLASDPLQRPKLSEALHFFSEMQHLILNAKHKVKRVAIVDVETYQQLKYKLLTKNEMGLYYQEVWLIDADRQYTYEQLVSTRRTIEIKGVAVGDFYFSHPQMSAVEIARYVPDHIRQKDSSAERCYFYLTAAKLTAVQKAHLESHDICPLTFADDPSWKDYHFLKIVWRSDAYWRARDFLLLQVALSPRTAEVLAVLDQAFLQRKLTFSVLIEQLSRLYSTELGSLKPKSIFPLGPGAIQQFVNQIKKLQLKFGQLKKVILTLEQDFERLKKSKGSMQINHRIAAIQAALAQLKNHLAVCLQEANALEAADKFLPDLSAMIHQLQQLRLVHTNNGAEASSPSVQAIDVLIEEMGFERPVALKAGVKK